MANKELKTIPRKIADVIIRPATRCWIKANAWISSRWTCSGRRRHLAEHEHQRSAGEHRHGTDGPPKGEYQYLNPNDHLNKCQSTNDAYPTGFRIAVYASNQKLIDAINQLREGFDRKAKEFETILKMGRTQLQDAVPMTLGRSSTPSACC